MNPYRDIAARLIAAVRALSRDPAARDDALRDLARETRTPLYRLHGLTTFYPHLQPHHGPVVNVCADLSCHLAQPTLLTTLQAAGVPARACSCLGLCDQPGAVEADGRTFAGVGPDQAGAIANGRLAEPQPLARSSTHQIDPYGHQPPYDALRRLVTTGDTAWVLRELQASGLRGYGGAGFPTARKWDLVRQSAAGEKFVICNADESEPGTFKDRFLLDHYPALVVEGLAIAAVAVGARAAYIFLRREYARQRARLVEAIADARRRAALGNGIFGSPLAVDIEIFDSPGGYICGEETALLEAMEGKRAEPRSRPPFPGTHGLWGQPTLINNVETLAWVPAILLRGGAWYAAYGQHGAHGLKFIALSGHVARPGVYEIPLGLPVAELIAQHGEGIHGGRRLKAFAPGGASSGFLPASLSNTPLDSESLAAAGSMLGSGAVVALAEGTCMVDAALNGLRFFRNESCGKCVPCRLGSEKLVGITEAWAHGRANASDLDLVRQLAEAMTATSICGLGQVAPNPLTSVMRHFPAEVAAHLDGRCPEGVCR